MIISFCTLLALLQLIKRFKLHVLKTRKLMPFSVGNTEETRMDRVSMAKQCL